MKHFQPAYLPDAPDLDAEVFKNDIYTVIKTDCEKIGFQQEGFPGLYWLSIKRNDKEPIHDWRELQRIKNMIIGAEHEAVELYPAESRKVDMANQYHLFVLKDKGLQFPFGFNERGIGTEKEAAKMNAKQRKL